MAASASKNGFSGTPEENLFRAVLSLHSVEECRAFFDDLLTSKEIAELSSRLEVARLLQNKVNYNDIVSATGASTATISRVSKCLSGEAGGYRIVLSRLTEKERAASGEGVLSGLSEEECRVLTHLADLLRD